MFKLIALVVLAFACTVSAKPQFIYSAPVAPAVVTASSSQYVARNYNGVAAAPVVAAAYTAPVAAAYTAPVAAAYTAPVAAAAYTAPVAAAYSAPYASFYPYTSAAYATYF